MSGSSAASDNPPAPVATRVTPLSATEDGDDTTAPKVTEKPKQGRSRKRVEVAPTTHPRSTLATKSGSSIQKVPKARQAAIATLATTGTEDGNEASQERTRPVS